MIDRTDPNFKRLVRDVVIVLVITLCMFVVASARGDSVRLLDQAAVEGVTVTLADVAELEGDEAVKHGGLVVAEIDNKKGRDATVTLDAVRDALTKRGVNWGRLSLRGYGRCAVSAARRVEDEPAEEGAAAASVAANPEAPVALGSAITLGDVVLDKLCALTGADRSDLRVKFSDADAKSVAVAATGADRFEAEPQSTTGLGRVPVAVRRWRGDQHVETLRVTAEVSRRVLAVVTTTNITRGQTFAPGDVELKEVFLDETRGTPMTDPSLVVGQNTSALLRKGSLVLAQHLKSPVLVKRGELMTVRCISGGLVVKSTGRAAEDGALDQVIAVRNERSREAYAVRVSGTREGVVVTDSPDTKDNGRDAAGDQK